MYNYCIQIGGNYTYGPNAKEALQALWADGAFQLRMLSEPETRTKTAKTLPESGWLIMIRWRDTQQTLRRQALTLMEEGNISRTRACSALAGVDRNDAIQITGLHLTTG